MKLNSKLSKIPSVGLMMKLDNINVRTLSQV